MNTIDEQMKSNALGELGSYRRLQTLRARRAMIGR